MNKPVSLLAAFFSHVGCAVWALSCLFEFIPFVLLIGYCPYTPGLSTSG
jgi:hypothetical protein